MRSERLVLRQNASARRPTRQLRTTHLCPCDIRRDDELYISVLENPQHDLPEVPRVQIASRLKQFRRSVLLPCLVLGPRLASVLACFGLFKLLLLLVLRAATREESIENKYRLDAEFFECAEV